MTSTRKFKRILVGVLLFYFTYLVACWIGYSSPIHRYMFGTYTLAHDSELYFHTYKGEKFVSSFEKESIGILPQHLEFKIILYEYEYMIDSEIEQYICEDIATGDRFSITKSYFEYIKSK